MSLSGNVAAIGFLPLPEPWLPFVSEDRFWAPLKEHIHIYIYRFLLKGIIQGS